MKKNKMKKFVSILLLSSFLFSKISFGSFQNIEDNTMEKEYVLITETANGHNASKAKLTSYEADKLKDQDGVVLVEEDGEVKGSSIKSNKFNKEPQGKQVNVNTNSSNESWNKKIINADTDTSSQNAVIDSSIKIALIDSGVNYSEDINVVERKNFIEDDENVSYLYEDISGHGTSIAGIIGSKEKNKNTVIGINPNVEIFSARVLDKNLTAPISRVVEAIYWAIDKGVNIISISFGTTENSDALKVAIQDAYDAGILVIAAAGNDGTVDYPAANDQVMAVGSINPEGNVSNFSPNSNKLEIVAPGENITSSAAFGGRMTGSGTSLSVPHIVGVASILWQKDTTRSADFIRNLMDYSANLYGDTKSYGNGLVDLKYALKIYDKFSDIYSEDNLETSVKKAEDAGILNYNTSELNTNWVEGSWTSTGHNGLVSSIYSLNGFVWSPQKYNAVMNGCVYPDNYMTSNLQYHGHLWVGSKDSTYIGCYLYITAVAKTLASNSKVDSNTPGIITGELGNDVTDLHGTITYDPTTGNGKVGGRYWSTICTSLGISNSPENRAAFVYGLAIHSATDVFAHCAWKYNSGDDTFYKVVHNVDTDGDSIGNADDTDYLTARYNVARVVSVNIMNNCNNSLAGTLFDFIIPKAYYDQAYSSTPRSQDFLLGNFNYYASLTGSPDYNTYIDYFRFGDLTYQCSVNGAYYGAQIQYTYDGIEHTPQ